MGEAWPSPGNSVFQMTLLVALQCTGTFVSALVPSSRGPRHCGQFSAWAKKHAERRMTVKIPERCANQLQGIIIFKNVFAGCPASLAAAMMWAGTCKSNERTPSQSLGGKSFWEQMECNHESGVGLPIGDMKAISDATCGL
jgi:hypothetical protein